MKSVIIASLIAAASAFAPAKQAPATTAVQAFENELGAQAPLGMFDPLGLCADGDQATFDRMRYTEIKHGRIAMIAVVGYLTNKAGIFFPGDISLDGTKFSDIGSGFDAITNLSTVGQFQIFMFIAQAEIMFMRDDCEWTGATAEFPGDMRNGFDFGWDKQSDEWKMKKRAIELNNGRAAQMGILGLMVHEYMGVSVLPGDVLP